MNHGGDDAVLNVVVGVAATVVEASLYVGGHQVGEHLRKMLDKAFLGTVGPEEAQLEEGLAQVFPLPPVVATAVAVALLFGGKRASDVETTVVKHPVVFLNGLGLAGESLVEELEQVGLLRLDGGPAAANGFGTLRRGGLDGGSGLRLLLLCKNCL